jgi:hypothetical protein
VAICCLLNEGAGRSLEVSAKVRRTAPRRATPRHTTRRSLARFIEQVVMAGSPGEERQPGISRFEVGIRTVPEASLLTAAAGKASDMSPRL